MNIGDRVLIGGRTMLRPGFSLVGLEAVVMPTFPNAPEGCVTVQIDWKGAGYDEEKYDDLPPFINVPFAHLERVTAKEEDTHAAPILGFINTRITDNRVLDEPSDARAELHDAHAKNNESPETCDETSTPDTNSDQPRLRLI